MTSVGSHLSLIWFAKWFPLTLECNHWCAENNKRLYVEFQKDIFFILSLLILLLWSVLVSSSSSSSPGGGGHSLKIRDGYVQPHWPPISNRLSPNDPLFIFHILLSPNDPHFKMLSHLMTPFFRNIYRWKWGSCSHWMTPIFTDKWWPRDMYPIFVWKEDLCSC